MLDIEGLNAAPESPTVVKRVAETQPEAETQKKAKTAAPGVDPSFETTAAPAFDPSFGVRAPVAGLTEPSTGEEDAAVSHEQWNPAFVPAPTPLPTPNKRQTKTYHSMDTVRHIHNCWARYA